jgi:ABC-type antimicrobial peptide transport system permease subunit
VVQHTATMGPEGPTRAAVYYDMRPGEHPTWVGFLVRTAGPPALLAHSLEASLAEVARPNRSAGAGVHVVADGFSTLTATRRFTAGLMSTFALFALGIGAAGIYAVMASIVAQQTKEIGVRVALGATAADIRGDVLARAGRHVIAGLAMGLPAGWLISRGFASLFFQVTPSDPSIYLIVAAILGLVALLAAIVPARRAANVDPVISLRAS